MNYGKEFTKGILKENPTLVGLLGMCPTLAVTTAAFNGIGMGLSTMFVLICSNIVISLLRKRDFRTAAHIIEFENDASRPNRLPVVGFYRKIDRRISHAGNDIGRRPIQRQFVGILHGDMPIGVAPSIERETTAVVGDRFERSRRNFQGSDSSVAVRIVVGAGIEYDGSCGAERRRRERRSAG